MATAFLASCGATYKRQITIDPATLQQAETPETLLSPCPDLPPLPESPPDVYQAVAGWMPDRAQYRDCAAGKLALIDAVKIGEGVR